MGEYAIIIIINVISLMTGFHAFHQCLGHVNLAEPITLLVKLYPMSSNSKARLAYKHVAVDSIRESLLNGRWLQSRKQSTHLWRVTTELAACINMEPNLLYSVRWLLTIQECWFALWYFLLLATIFTSKNLIVEQA